MKQVVLLWAVLASSLGCGKDAKDDGDKGPTSAAGSARSLGDDPKVMMDEMLALMTELGKTAEANKADCATLGKAMHAKMDALAARFEQAKLASQTLEKKWAGKSTEERMELMSKMPQLEAMAKVGETTSTILEGCSDDAEVARFVARLEKLIGR
jgi:hypothetical protein